MFFMRRIIVICFLTVALLASPAMAGGSLIWINGYPTNIDVVWKNDHIYVPIRYVAQNLNCDVKWTGERVEIQQVLVRPRMGNNSDFNKVINAALDILEDKDMAHYCMVCQNVENITMILPNERTISFYAESLRDMIAISPTLYNDSKRFTPVYVAGLLAHEATHVCYHHKSVEDQKDFYESEKIAYEHELACLRLIDAPQWMIKETELIRAQHLKRLE
jgi:hypothetical protein